MATHRDRHDCSGRNRHTRFSHSGALYRTDHSTWSPVVRRDSGKPSRPPASDPDHRRSSPVIQPADYDRPNLFGTWMVAHLRPDRVHGVYAVRDSSQLLAVEGWQRARSLNSFQ